MAISRKDPKGRKLREGEIGVMMEDTAIVIQM